MTFPSPTQRSRIGTAEAIIGIIGEKNHLALSGTAKVDRPERLKVSAAQRLFGSRQAIGASVDGRIVKSKHLFCLPTPRRTTQYRPALWYINVAQG